MLHNNRKPTLQEKDTCSLSDRQTKHGCARYAKVTLRLLVTLAAAKTQAGPLRLAAIPDREISQQSLSACALQHTTNNPNKTLMKGKENLDQAQRRVRPLITANPVMYQSRH